MTKLSRGPSVPMDYKLLERIRVDANGCFNWIHYRDKDGYGKTCLGGIVRSAHRISFEVFRRPIPPGLHVLHHCDNPSCINPAHLFLGTQLDNSRDAVSKLRQAHSERARQVRLSAAQVLDVCARYKCGESSVHLAKEYGVTPRAISCILAKKSWKYLDRECVKAKPSGRYGKVVEAFGERKTLSEWSSDARCRVSWGTLKDRIRRGWDSERAITQQRRAYPKGA